MNGYGRGAVGRRRQKKDPEKWQKKVGRESQFKCNNSGGALVQRGHCPRLEQNHLIIRTYITHLWTGSHTLTTFSTLILIAGPCALQKGPREGVIYLQVT